MNHFFAYLDRLKLIRRWGLMRNTVPENDMEHSMQTALIAHGLAVLGKTRHQRDIDPAHVVVLALYHDVGEVITGDLPTPVKYFNPEIRDAYKQVESVAAHKLLSMLPEEFRPTYREILTIPDPEVRALVKAADKLSAYLKCVEELKAGNLEFKKAGEQTYEALRQNPLPALAYFMERFLPGFHLTLDELQGSGDEIFGQTTIDLTSGKEGTQL